MRWPPSFLGLTLVLYAAAALVASQAAAQSGPVLVVGDSLEVGTGPHLRRELAAVPVTVDARRGRPSSEGVRILRERLRSGHQVVVFDLGTNDDPSRTATFARNLAAARKLAGDRCLVVSTLARPPAGGVPVDGLNRIIRDFADATPDARLVEWEAAVKANPALLTSDDVHATRAGYAARARLVAAGVEECFGAVDPPREAPEPEPPRARGPRNQAAVGSWSELLGRAPYGLVAGYVRWVADIVILAGQNVGGALGRRPPEVELGAPKPSR